eukprot:COSAG01_NODE_57023_length_315_cov_0.476852_1_plen_40_part_10
MSWLEVRPEKKWKPHEQAWRAKFTGKVGDDGGHSWVTAPG